MAREFFPDEGGELFGARRDSGRGTVKQRLEPDRLRHFIALTELPDDLYAPLRRIAEREFWTR